MKKILVLLILFSYKISFSQLVNPPLDVKSPTASSLGKYGDIPVSHYNGSTNVAIPLYTINEREIPLEIYLNYDSGGIRVNSVASWVGQNWSLNAGGVITRSIRDKVDVLNYNFNWGIHNYQYSRKGFKYAGHRLNNTNWSTTNSLTDLVHESNLVDTPNPYHNMDLEPDIFTFNFMGITGKFFLDNNGNWRVQSNSKLKIKTYERVTPNLFQDRFDGTPNEPSSDVRNDIGKIIITDEKGNQYIFGSTNDHIEYSLPIPETILRAKFIERPSTWYLSSVMNSKGITLYNFEYERVEPIIHVYRNNSFKIGSCLSENGVAYTITYDRTHGDNFRTTRIYPVYLKNIQTYSGNRIEFEITNINKKPFENHFTHDDMEWKKLDQIKIYNYNDKLVRSIGLEYHTIGNNLRLNLKAIHNNIEANQIQTMYSFEYDRFNELPNYLSKKIDKWGFYNGQEYIVRSMNYEGWTWALGQSPPDDHFSEHDSSRASNENFAIIGMLKKLSIRLKDLLLLNMKHIEQ
ncbi:MAG: hypothetical protein GKR88_14770 [Flavobacteriaceae bacterium]|nr:MAG: hypothetical protein GKR88_14770 [Flavobacteriaceae bacterium]